MKYTNYELIKKMVKKYKKKSFTLADFKATLLVDFEINSIKYKQIATEYIRSTHLALSDEGYGSFNLDNLTFVLNMENDNVIKIFMELAEVLKKPEKEKAEQEADEVLKTFVEAKENGD